MTPHEWFWCGLTALMVTLLPRCKGCRVFFVVQFVQLLEIPIIIHWPSWNPWHEITKINVLMDIPAIWCCRYQYPWACAVMFVADILTVFRESPFDLDFQLIVSPMSLVICWLDRAIVVILLMYILDSPRFREIGERCTINVLSRTLPRLMMMER